MNCVIEQTSLKLFKNHLIIEEKSAFTVENYVRSISKFIVWLCAQTVDKALVLRYKEHLAKTCKLTTANCAISALNSFFDFLGAPHLKVKTFKIQREIFYSDDKELTKAEYNRLLKCAKAKKNRRLFYLMQTICACGIRVSELKFITADAVLKKRAAVMCKGKCRTVILPDKLCKILTRYMKEKGIKSGCVFVTRSGRPLNRSNIWREMNKLCKAAGVKKTKVFPHNLRHLFARTYYTYEKDIVRLADILGHSSINTTRIYTMESGSIHREHIQKLGLILTT